VATRGLGRGGLLGGARQVSSLRSLAGQTVARNIGYYGNLLLNMPERYTQLTERSVIAHIASALTASRRNVDTVLALNGFSFDPIEQFFFSTGALSKLSERLPLRGYTARAIRQAY